MSFHALECKCAYRGGWWADWRGQSEFADQGCGDLQRLPALGYAVAELAQSVLRCAGFVPVLVIIIHFSVDCCSLKRLLLLFTGSGYRAILLPLRFVPLKEAPLQCWFLADRLPVDRLPVGRLLGD